MWIEGRNPVREALRAGRPIRRLLIAEGTSRVDDIVEAARSSHVRVERVPRSHIDGFVSGVHQGVAAETDDFVYRSWREGLVLASERGELALFLALDGITDPHNVGSLLRSAEAAGAHAAILPARRASPVTAVVEKAAAGATSHLIVDQVTNLQRTLAEAKEAGVWIVALDMDGEADLFDHPLLVEPVAIVVGAEGSGVSRLVRERADARVRIPMSGRTASLNAGVAGAIAMFETKRQRRL